MRDQMTETARRLRRLGAPHARARAFAMMLGGLGAALAAAALGLALSPAVSGVTVAWMLIATSGVGAIGGLRRARGAGARGGGRGGAGQHRRSRRRHRGPGYWLERGAAARRRYARRRRRYVRRAERTRRAAADDLPACGGRRRCRTRGRAALSCGFTGVGSRRRVLAPAAHVARRAGACAPGRRSAKRPARWQCDRHHHSAWRDTRDALDARSG